MVRFEIDMASPIIDKNSKVFAYKVSHEISCEWTVAFVWLKCSVPKAMEIRRFNDVDEFVIAGEIEFLRNGRTIAHKKCLQLIEPGTKLLKINLFTVEVLPIKIRKQSFSIKGFIDISSSGKAFYSISSKYEENRQELLSLKKLSNDFVEMWHSEGYSSAPDVNFVCGCSIIPAHKAVLCARSPVFAAMFTNPMREHFDLRVEIKDIDDTVMLEMIKYIYKGRFTGITDFLALGLLKASDKYQIDCLKTACREFLQENISIENAFLSLNVGDECDQQLKSFALNYICNYGTLSIISRTKGWGTLQKTKPFLISEISNLVARKRKVTNLKDVNHKKSKRSKK